jgi:hypothetical protein
VTKLKKKIHGNKNNLAIFRARIHHKAAIKIAFIHYERKGIKNLRDLQTAAETLATA